jgi:hypothetical protein
MNQELAQRRGEHSDQLLPNDAKYFPAPPPRLDFLPEAGVPQSAGKAKYEVSLSKEVHREEQARLYNECFSKVDGDNVLPWRYDECPHGQVIAPVAFGGDSDPNETLRGKLIASYAAQPRRVHFRGEALGAAAVAQTGDVMTDAGARSSGVFTDLHWIAMERAREARWPAAWGLPNKFSGHIFFDKLGWRHAGHIGPWNFVLTTGDRARAIRLHNGRLAKWGTPWSAWRGRTARKSLGFDGSTVEELSVFHDEVEALSSLVEEGFDWMVHRDANYLNWRYLKAPCQRFQPLGIRDRSGTLVGYSVAQRPLPGTGLGFIVDLVGADEAAEGAALDAALEWLSREGCAVVRAYGMRGSHWEGVLERGGFRRPRGYKEVGAYPIWPDHPLADSTIDTSRWYFMDGDRDDEFAR